MFTQPLRTAIVAMLLVLLAGCGGSSPPAPQLIILEQPAINDVPNAPLAKQLTMRTNLNANIVADFSSSQGENFRITFNIQNIQNPQGSFESNVTILGLRPGRDYTVTVTAITDDGISLDADAAVMFSTDPLPADFPAITVNTVDTDNVEPGITLFDARKKDDSAAYIVVLDADGEVTWYFRPAGPSSTRLAFSGGLLTIDESLGLIRELNWRGEVRTETIFGTEFVNSFYSSQSGDPIDGSTAVDALNFHDDVFRDANTRTYFTSAQNTESVDDFPLDEFDDSVTGTANVLDEPIVEFDTAGDIVNSWNLLDILQPTRIGFDGTDGLPDAADWSHVNSVLFAASVNDVLVSLRHQDAVVAFSRSTGDLRWILGNPDNWSTAFDDFLFSDDSGMIEWPYHQHGISITATGTILMLDNGNRRASPFTGQAIVTADMNRSRAVEYSIDLETMQAEQVWEWEMSDGGEMLYSTTAGNVIRLTQTGNTLMTFGALCDEGGVPSDNLDDCRTTARIIEVDTDSGDTVFDISVDSVPADSGYIVWRSERLPGLYTLENGVITPL